jgi:uncharacterized protein (TIGR02271 family)
MKHRDPSTYEGKKVVDPSGDKIGTVDDLFVDESTREPEWLLLDTGIFGKDTVIPVQGAEFLDDDTIRVPFSKDQVKDGPELEPEDYISEADEQRLYSYYGIESSMESSETRYAESDRPSGHRTEGDAMTRSEEEVDIHKERKPRERARLRKRIVTEPVQKTVPVEREEVFVEREPITDSNRDEALRGPSMTEDTHEEVLFEEDVKVDKRTEPKERVRLDKDTTSEERTVSDERRKEEIDVERERDEKRDERDERGHRAA